MSDEMQELAQQISRGMFTENVGYWLVLLLVWVAVTAGAAFFGAYWRIKGENKARHDDKEVILEQLRQSTKAVEQIRSSINARFGEERDVKVLLRQKLEEVLSLTVELQAWFSKVESDAKQGLSTAFTTGPLVQISALIQLYFPNNKKDNSDLSNATLDLITFWIKRALKIATAKGAKRELESANWLEEWQPLWERFLVSLTVLQTNLIEGYAKDIGLRQEAE